MRRALSPLCGGTGQASETLDSGSGQELTASAPRGNHRSVARSSASKMCRGPRSRSLRFLQDANRAIDLGGSRPCGSRLCPKSRSPIIRNDRADEGHRLCCGRSRRWRRRTHRRSRFMVEREIDLPSVGRPPCLMRVASGSPAPRIPYDPIPNIIAI